MTRTRTNWKVRDHVLTIGERTLIMGVLNVTPDSFSDGGKFLDPDAAVAHALELEQQGADILDIGAESTRPGSERINAGEELRRLVPVLKRLKGQLSIPISVDTYKAEVAEKALEHGASIINDISALTWEPDLVKTVVKFDAGLILNHMRGTPETWAKLGPMKDVMGSLVSELEAAIHRAVRGGVDRDRIVIDPGIGFGKRGDQNSEILARLGELQRLMLPVLVAASRKLFLSQEDAKALEFATAAAVTTAILNGAAIVRVHDVAAMKPVVQTADSIVDATPEREEKAKPAVKARLDSDIQAERRSRPVRPPRVEKVEPPRPVAAREDLPVEKTERPTPEPKEAKPEDRPRRPFERRSALPEPRPERKPYQRRDDDRPAERPQRRPYERSGPPSRQTGPKDSKPFERRDRPFPPREDQRGDRPDRRPYQRTGPPVRRSDGKEQKPYQRSGPRSGPPARKSDERDQRPYQRRDDRPARPYQRADRSEERTDRRPPAGRPPAGRPATGRPPAGRPPAGRPATGRPPAGRPYDDRGGSKFGGGGRPSGPRSDSRDDRPGGGGRSRPGGGGGNRPMGPKRSGGPPRGGPKKRS